MSDNEIKSNIKKPNIFYCSNCVYPSSSAVSLQFDKNLVCSGCIISREKFELDWNKGKKELEILLNQYKNKFNATYDCIIPVSGGKDSYYQAHTMKELGMNALLVTYNANNYSQEGLENLHNMKETFGFDHIFFTPAINTLKKLNRLGMLIMGDMNWHAHSGIFTYPIQVAVNLNIPLMIWGEHGRTDMGGMFSHTDKIEFTYRERLEHACRGYEWFDIIKLSQQYNENLNAKEMGPWIYPNDHQIQKIGIRGVFLSNYIKWEANEFIELIKKKYGFKESKKEFERTFRKMSNLDDIHENGIHDYLKFIKFGYGRASDHASKDIRAKLMSRNDAIKEVMTRDHVKSYDLKRWLDYVGWDENKFDKVSEKFRDPRVWWIKDSKWFKQNIDGTESSYGEVKLEKKDIHSFYVVK